MTFIKVDFPAPELPIIAIRVPGGTAPETFLIIGFEPLPSPRTTKFSHPISQASLRYLFSFSVWSPGKL